MQEKTGEQGAAYIPMPKGRGFTPHFDKLPYISLNPYLAKLHIALFPTQKIAPLTNSEAL